MIFALSPLFLSFDGLCPQQEPRAVQTRGHSIAWKSSTFTPLHEFFATFAERAQFHLEYSMCDVLPLRHPLSFSLHSATSTQIHVSRTIPEASNRNQGPGSRDFAFCPDVVRNCTPAIAPPTEGSLFAEPDVCEGCTGFKRRGSDGREDLPARATPTVSAVHVGFGEAEEFLDVTRFLCCTAITPLNERLYLSGITQPKCEWLSSGFFDIRDSRWRSVVGI